MSLATILAFVIAAWLAGAAFGYFVRDALPASFTSSSGSRRRRRRTGYYFSDDDRSWADRRWRRRLGVITMVFVSVLLTASGAIALMNFKARPNAASGYRSN